jgi:hypothetical protein
VTSRRQIIDRANAANARAESAEAHLEAAEYDARVCAYALELVAGKLSRAKDVIASVITAAGHPDTAVQDVRAFAAALAEQLTAARVDIRLELDRLEGADL